MDTLMLICGFLLLGFCTEDDEVVKVVVTHKDMWIDEHNVRAIIFVQPEGYYKSKSKNKNRKTKCLNIENDCKTVTVASMVHEEVIKKYLKKDNEDLLEIKRVKMLCNVMVKVLGIDIKNVVSTNPCETTVEKFDDFIFILDLIENLEIDITNKDVVANFYRHFIPGFLKKELNNNISLVTVKKEELFPVYWKINSIMNYLGYGLIEYVDSRDEFIVYCPVRNGFVGMEEQMELLKRLTNDSCLKVEIEDVFIEVRKTDPSVVLGNVMNALRKSLVKIPITNFVVARHLSVDREIVLLWERTNDSLILKNITMREMIEFISNIEELIDRIEVTIPYLSKPLFNYLKERCNMGISINIKLAVLSSNIKITEANPEAQKIEYVELFLSHSGPYPGSDRGYFSILFKDRSVYNSVCTSFWYECKNLVSECLLRSLVLHGATRSLIPLDDDLSYYTLKHRSIPATFYHFKDFIEYFTDDIKDIEKRDSKGETYIHELSFLYNSERDDVVRVIVTVYRPEHLSFSICPYCSR